MNLDMYHDFCTLINMHCKLRTLTNERRFPRTVLDRIEAGFSKETRDLVRTLVPA